jgi:hypothetical protein
MAVTLDRQGTRIYLTGDTYPIRDRIKAIGGHWDGDRRAWWVGAAKASEAEALVNGAASSPQSTETRKVSDDSRVVAKVEYKGRKYYALWMGVCKSGASKAHLTVLDGSIDFWADMSLCTVLKRYETREYRGREEHTTLGGLRKFIERVKSETPEQSAKRTYDAGWRNNGCASCRAKGDWCESCAFDEFDN